MQFGVRGVTVSQLTALLSIVSTIFLIGCSTTSGTADDPHADDVPANYRTQIADFIRTQRDVFGLPPNRFLSGAGKKVLISDPIRTIGKGMWVCVLFDNGSGGWREFTSVRAYGFIHGQLQPDTGGVIAQNGRAVLIFEAVCGASPNWKPFTEAEIQPQSQRTQPQPRKQSRPTGA